MPKLGRVPAAALAPALHAAPCTQEGLADRLRCSTWQLLLHTLACAAGAVGLRGGADGSCTWGKPAGPGRLLARSIEAVGRLEAGCRVWDSEGGLVED